MSVPIFSSYAEKQRLNSDPSSRTTAREPAHAEDFAVGILLPGKICCAPGSILESSSILLSSAAYSSNT